MTLEQIRDLEVENRFETYESIINQKHKFHKGLGIEKNPLPWSDFVFDYQVYSIYWALKKGRSAILADTGLGKTIMELEWAKQVQEYTNSPVIILTTLMVSYQMLEMALNFGYDAVLWNEKTDLKTAKIVITNYEKLDKLQNFGYLSLFSGVVLDESSILKGYNSKTKEKLINAFSGHIYKLAATATMSPNDYIEIGNHAEWLGIMRSVDMVAKYFTTDKSKKDKTNKYYLKAHAEKDFFAWVKSWALIYRNPSDLGFSDENYIIPELKEIDIDLITPIVNKYEMYNTAKVSATSLPEEMRRTLNLRCEKCAEFVNNSGGQWIVWTELNPESELLKTLIDSCVEISGSDKPDIKAQKFIDFKAGKHKVLITKPKIARFGLNLQNCNQQFFVSPDFSFESYYQAVRRSLRFGSEFDKVLIYRFQLDTTFNVKKAIEVKQTKHDTLYTKMMEVEPLTHEVKTNPTAIYKRDGYYELYQGDTITTGNVIEDDSIDYSFFSPPFGAMYVFSDDPEDVSNVSNDFEFYMQMRYFAKHLYRILKEGRLCSIHIMQSTTLKGKEGYISIKDYRGEMIRIMQSAGFHFHGEADIWKDVQQAAKRTKNQQLLYGHVKKDFAHGRHGLMDYIVTFRKGQRSAMPVIDTDIDFDLWCKMADPVWFGMNASDTLTKEHTKRSKTEKDEKHITPTQKKPINWLIQMYTNRGETVYSPFAGIATEGHEAILLGRKFKGHELKESYCKEAVRNLNSAVEMSGQLKMY